MKIKSARVAIVLYTNTHTHRWKRWKMRGWKMREGGGVAWLPSVWGHCTKMRRTCQCPTSYVVFWKREFGWLADYAGLWGSVGKSFTFRTHQYSRTHLFAHTRTHARSPVMVMVMLGAAPKVCWPRRERTDSRRQTAAVRSWIYTRYTVQWTPAPIVCNFWLDLERSDWIMFTFWTKKNFIFYIFIYILL